MFVDENGGYNSSSGKTALESFMGASLSGAKEDETNNIMESLFSLIVPVKPALTQTSFFPSSVPPQPLSLPIPRKPGEDREICVARFGKIYKRKAPSSIGHLVKPCAPGYRFCRFCNATLPLSAFYTNVKRYVCKRHHYLRVNKTFKLRIAGKFEEKYAQDMWYRLSDARYQLGYDKLRFDASDIKDIIEKSNIPKEIIPVLIPIDPKLPMRPRNVAVVSSRAFSFALKLYSFTCSRSLFIGFVQKCNLLPPNFDVARPDNPFHDPSYVRQDCDLIKIMEEESQYPTVHETEDRTIIEELRNNEDVPWINRIPRVEETAGTGN
jgi:hypothetical protein